ncbi:MAG: ComEC/Rec2 family competence protein [Alphaproteobacteria bacterium]
MTAIVMPSGGGAAIGARALAAIQRDIDRWALWLPVAMGLGVATYFTLADEPASWLGPAAFAGLLGLAAALRRNALGLAAGLFLAAGALGFSAAQISALLAAAPRVEHRQGAVAIEGRIVEAGARPNGVRLLLAPTRIEGWQGALPRRLRITFSARLADPDVRPGRIASFRGVLLPIPAPAAPDAFDFQRQAFFQGLGGLGYATARLRTAAAPQTGGALEWVEGLRHDITQRIRTAIGGPAGAVAAALVTGERTAIPEEVNAAMRDTGLAHLLSISGLHFSLVAGLVFTGLRVLLAMVPALALRFPIKKWAAAAAIGAAFFYLLLSGADVPTQRSFLMIGIVFLAVLVDREAISLRLVAWAAAAILLVLPEALMGASFQMSFAAVLALVAAYEGGRDRIRRLRQGTPLGRTLLYVALVCLTTVIATTATTPFALYHFNRFAAYALPANLIAVPLTSFWVMPWAVIAVLAMPLGLEAWPLAAMGWGVEAIIAAATWIAAWPGAAWTVPAMPAWGIALFCAGGLWLCLWRQRMRWWGVPVAFLGLLSISLPHPPDLLVDADARAVAVRGPAGYWIFEERPAPIVVETWLRRAAFDRLGWPDGGADPTALPRCDDRLCRLRHGAERIAIARTRNALTEACRTADVVIALVPMRWDCGRGVLAIDRSDLERSGAHALRLGGERQVRTTAAQRGRRPWVGSAAAGEGQ